MIELKNIPNRKGWTERLGVEQEAGNDKIASILPQFARIMRRIAKGEDVDIDEVIRLVAANSDSIEEYTVLLIQTHRMFLKIMQDPTTKLIVAAVNEEDLIRIIGEIRPPHREPQKQKQ